MGEEGGSEDGTSGLDWVVDPLDGTVNFLFGIPQWCVSVAVRDGEGTLAGAVYDPNRDELFTATRDGTARLSGADGDGRLTGAAGAVAAGSGDEGVELRGTRREELATAMVATGLAYDARVRAAQAKVLARVIPKVRDIRRFGSAALDLRMDGGGALRRLLRAHGQALGHRRRRADLRTRRAACAGLARARGPAVRHPRRAGGARGAAAGAGWRTGVEQLGAQVPTGGHDATCVTECGGWESNPHALADRGF